MQKKRSRVLHWIATRAGLETRLTRPEWMAAYRIGASTVIEKPYWMDTAMYREMLDEHAAIAHDYLVLGRRRVQEPPSAVYEPPDKQTGPIKPVASREQLRKFLDTQSLPAVPGAVARSWHKKHKDSA